MNTVAMMKVSAKILIIN